MAEVLKKKEIHVFSRFDQNLAFDVNDMHLFEINRLTKEIFEQVDGKTPHELTAILSDHFPPAKVLDVLGQLMKLKLIGYTPALPGTWRPEVETTNNGIVHDNEKTDHGINRLVLFVCQDCNLKCNYCSSRHRVGIKKKYMSKEVAWGAVDLFFHESNKVHNLEISFYGGEPMLHFDLIKMIIPYANQKAEKRHKTVKYTMTTNGTLLTDEAIQFMIENNIHSIVRLDGSSEIHDNNRVFPDGSGSFAKVFPPYNRLKENLSETTTLTVLNSFDVPMKDIAQSLLDLGIPKVNIVPAVSITGKLEIPVLVENGCDNCDSVDIYNKQYEEFVQYFLDNEMIFHEKPPLDYTRIFEYLDKREKRSANCEAAYTRLAVDVEGNILPCENFIAEPSFYMGNVLTGLDGSCRNIFKELRTANNETCRTCWARHLCGGWCPFFSFNRYHDLKTPVDDQCRINKNRFEIDMAVYSLFKRRKKIVSQN